MRRVVEMFYFIFIKNYLSTNYILTSGADGNNGKFDCRNITCGIGQEAVAARLIGGDMDRSQVCGSEIRIFSGVRGSWFRREQTAK
jgi:hypothetical protein